MDKLDDTTYLNMRKFHERNTAGEKKKWTMMGRVLPPFKKAQRGTGVFRKVWCIKTSPPPKNNYQ